VGNEHQTWPVGEIIRSLRQWRRCASRRDLLVPPRGCTSIAGVAFSDRVARYSRENHQAAVWALIGDRRWAMAEHMRRVLVERGDFIGGFPELTVFADELQAAGDPLGVAIAVEMQESPRFVDDDHERSLTRMLAEAAGEYDVSITRDWFAGAYQGFQKQYIATNVADRIAANLPRDLEHQAITLDSNFWAVTRSEIGATTWSGVQVGTLEMTSVTPIGVMVPTLAGQNRDDRLDCTAQFEFGDETIVNVEFSPRRRHG
jgi:hypothetical protein